MRIAYGDLIGGVSGDMFVGALVDLGVPPSKLKSELKKIPTLKFALKAVKKSVHSVRATQLRVIAAEHEPSRSWKEIRALIEESKLDPEVKQTGSEIFSRLAKAEGKIHGIAVERVHFHEIGATDSIVDIMAVAIGVRELGIGALYFSPIPLGRGVTRSRHGPLPIPGPATLELLKGLPVHGVDVEGETVTPTGAAILCVLGKAYGEQPHMKVEKIGYGAGQKVFPSRPNLFRLVLGSEIPSWRREEMLVIETNIDDMNPQFYDHAIGRLFTAGARDVYLAPVQMKKNRPAILLTVICEPPSRDRMAEIIFQETSTIGMRYYPVSRMILKRAAKKVATRFGNITIKIVEQPDGRMRAAPEYDDLKRIAAAKKIPIKKLYDEIMRILATKELSIT